MASVKPAKVLTCYICLQKNTSILIKPRSEWRSLFEFCIGLPVKKKRAHHSICVKCEKTLRAFGRFKRQCLRSSTFWNNLTTQQEIPTIKCDTTNDDSDYIKDEKSSYWESIDVDNQYYDKVDSFDYPVSAEDHKIKTEEDELPCNKKLLIENVDVEFVKTQPETSGQIKVESQNDEKDWQNEAECDEQITNKGRKNCAKKVATAKNFEVPQMCGICTYTSERLEDTNKHVLDIHCGEGQMKCQSCDYIGRDAADMVSHRYNHWQPKKLLCPTCGKRFRTSTLLQFHYRSVHLKKAGYWCELCGYKNRDWKQRYYHELKHKGIEFICDYCNKDFFKKGNLRYHIKYQHAQKRDDLKTFVCELCGDRFFTKYNLQSHIKCKHGVVQKVKCEHCNRYYKNQEYLAEHLKTLNIEKRFVCDICSKRFFTASELKTHMYAHSTERPFDCKHCPKKFKTKSTLVSHTRQIHELYRPHKCSVCESAFQTSGGLKRHESVHTGVRSYKCEYCPRSFNEKSMMIKHCLNNHEISKLNV